MNENCSALIQTSSKFVPKGPIDNKPSLIPLFRKWLNRQQPIMLSNDDQVSWRIIYMRHQTSTS